MRIIRFQKITTSDYNYVNRLLKKSWFIPRKFSWIILLKATILHRLQKKSWRVLSKEFSVWHIALFNFYSFIKNKPELEIILHRFISNRIILFVGEKQVIKKDYLDNSEEVIILTKRELKTKLENI